MSHRRFWPNILTALRFVLIPLLMVLLAIEQTTWVAFWAWFVFAFAAFTDWLDGYLARKFDCETVFGKLMDPLADKLLVTAALLMLIPLGRIAAWVCLLIISREMLVTGVRGLAASKNVVVPADSLGKIKANFQYYGIGFLIFPVGLLPIPYQHVFAIILIWISIIVSYWSAWQYMYALRGLFSEKS